MKSSKSAAPITVFTPSFADEDNINAQNLTTKEIVTRLPPDLFRVVMLCGGSPDPRIARRKNTVLLRYRKHGNAIAWIARALLYAPDIYFFPREGPLDSGFLFLRKLLHLKTAVITYSVSGGMDRAMPSAARQRNIREADVVAANSVYLSELVRQHFAVDAITIYDGVDRRFFFPTELRNATTDSPTVLYAGSFRSYKRADMVVRAAAKYPGAHFRLAGSGEQEHNCRRLARQLGCGNVDFLGSLRQPKLGEEMRRADVFFFPSTVEGHPQVLLQAAACGLPAVAMNSYRPEYVVDGVTGFLAGSDEELFSRLDTLLAQPELRRSMSEAASSHSCKFAWDQIAGQWTEIFQQAVRKRRPMLRQTTAAAVPSDLSRRCEF